MGASSACHYRVAMEWHGTVLCERVLHKRGFVTIGDSPEADLTVPELSGEMVFADLGEEGLALEVPAGWGGTVVIDGCSARPHADGSQAVLGVNDSACLKPDPAGAATIIVEPVSRAELSGKKSYDWILGEALVFAAILHLATLGVSFAFGEVPQADRGPGKLEKRKARFILSRPKPPPPPKKLEIEDEEHLKTERPKLLVMTDKKRRTDKKDIGAKVKNKGVLAILNRGDKTMTALFADASNDKIGAALDHLTGDSGRFARHYDGGGGVTRGTAIPGAGGGFGGFGGFGGEASYSSKAVPGSKEAASVRSRLDKKKEKKVRVDITGGNGSLNVEGDGLSKGEIMRVIKSRSKGIRYCYERELVVQPTLAGKMTVQWWIDAEGEVFKAVVADSTTNSQGLEECMLRQVRRWRFPRTDAGNVTVRFPFIFQGS